MATGDPTEMERLEREVIALLRRAYDLGRADALRDAAAMLSAEAAPAAANDRGQAAPPLPRRRRPVEHARGRPDAMTDDRKATAATLLAEGRLSRRRIAREIGVSPSRFYRWLKERGKAGE